VIHLLTQDHTSDTLAPWPTAFLITAVAWLVICGVVLFVIDLQQHRLPNAWTGLLFGAGGSLLIASSLSAPTESVLAGRWLPTLLGSVSYLAIMFVLHLVTRAGLGMGDVKLAAGLGLYTGFLGADALVAGFVFAFLIGGLQAIFLMVFRGASKSTRIAFGPAMLLGSFIVVMM